MSGKPNSTFYLAGPMRGYPDHNYPAFFDAAERIRSRGFPVLNPAENCGPNAERAAAAADAKIKWGATFGDFFRPDLMMLADTDALCMLPGWRESQGASLEYRIAREMGLPVFHLNDGLLEPLFTVIGISGYAGSGKDTIATALVESCSYERLSFADCVRDLLYEFDPIVKHPGRHGDYYSIRGLVDGMGWERAKRTFPVVREAQQAIGQGARQVLGENVWVDACLAKMRDGGKYVFSDLRYPNEAAAIKKLGGEVWRVQRPGFGPVNDHVSEIALDDYDYDLVLENDGVQADLWQNAVELVA